MTLRRRGTVCHCVGPSLLRTTYRRHDRLGYFQLPRLEAGHAARQHCHDDC